MRKILTVTHFPLPWNVLKPGYAYKDSRGTLARYGFLQFNKEFIYI